MLGRGLGGHPSPTRLPRTWPGTCLRPRVTMGLGGGAGGCGRCKLLAPFMARFFPADDPGNAHLYAPLHTLQLEGLPSEIRNLTDTGALGYLTEGDGAEAEAGGGSTAGTTSEAAATASPSLRWCRKVSLVGHPDLHVLEVLAPFGKGYCVPVKTTGDGNCLTHAVSRGVWGAEMWYSHLREAMVREMLEHREWYVEQLAIAEGLDAPAAATAFSTYVTQASTDGEYLSLLHVSALAHAMRRPIVVLDSGVQMGKRGYGFNGTWGVFPPLRLLQNPVYWVGRLRETHPGSFGAVLGLLSRLLANATKGLGNPAEHARMLSFRARNDKIVAKIGAPLCNIDAADGILRAAGFKFRAGAVYTLDVDCDDAAACSAAAAVVARAAEAVAKGREEGPTPATVKASENTGAGVDGKDGDAAEPTPDDLISRPLVVAWANRAHSHFVPLCPVASLEAPEFPMFDPAQHDPFEAGDDVSSGVADPFCEAGECRRIVCQEPTDARFAWHKDSVRRASWVPDFVMKLNRKYLDDKARREEAEDAALIESAAELLRQIMGAPPAGASGGRDAIGGGRASEGDIPVGSDDPLASLPELLARALGGVDTGAGAGTGGSSTAEGLPDSAAEPSVGFSGATRGATGMEVAGQDGAADSGGGSASSGGGAVSGAADDGGSGYGGAGEHK